METIKKTNILSKDGIRFEVALYPDGDIVFWSDKKFFEFGKDEFEKFLQFFKDSSITGGQTSSAFPRRIRKSEHGWAVDFLLDGGVVTYHYKSRSAARNAKANDCIGGSGGRIK